MSECVYVCKSSAWKREQIHENTWNSNVKPTRKLIYTEYKFEINIEGNEDKKKK